MGDFGTNDAEVRGSACDFPVVGHTKKINTAEGWVLAAGDGRSSPTGSVGTFTQYVWTGDMRQATGKSGVMGDPTT